LPGDIYVTLAVPSTISTDFFMDALKQQLNKKAYILTIPMHFLQLRRKSDGCIISSGNIASYFGSNTDVRSAAIVQVQWELELIPMDSNSKLAVSTAPQCERSRKSTDTGLSTQATAESSMTSSSASGVTNNVCQQCTLINDPTALTCTACESRLRSSSIENSQLRESIRSSRYPQDDRKMIPIPISSQIPSLGALCDRLPKHQQTVITVALEMQRDISGESILCSSTRCILCTCSIAEEMLYSSYLLYILLVQTTLLFFIFTDIAQQNFSLWNQLVKLLSFASRIDSSKVQIIIPQYECPFKTRSNFSSAPLSYEHNSIERKHSSKSERVIACPHTVASFLLLKHDKAATEKWSSFVFRESKARDTLMAKCSSEIWTEHQHVSSVVRKNAVHSLIFFDSMLVVQDVSMIIDPQHHVILFDETFQDLSAANEHKHSDIPRKHNSKAATVNLTSVDEKKTELASASTSDADVQVDADKTESPTSRRQKVRNEASALCKQVEEYLGIQANDLHIDGMQASLRNDVPSVDSSSGQLSSSDKRTLARGTDIHPTKSSVNIMHESDQNNVNMKQDGTSTNPDDADFHGLKHSQAPSFLRMSEAHTSKSIAQQHRYRGLHLFVLQHGYQGSSWDMRTIKNRLSLLMPDALFLSPKSNEGKTEGDIREMGQRLAAEISEFIEENCSNSIGKLSFFCHSLGGIIVRAALHEKAMAKYLSKCYTYVSLASPHCGFLFNQSSLVSTGMWVLKKWYKSVCLNQLELGDDTDYKKTFMFELSKFNELSNFAHIFLVASQQDKYVPFHSARVESSADINENVDPGRAYSHMVTNMLSNFNSYTLIKRIDVGFVAKKLTLDSMIGRTAHIFFLDHHQFITMFLNVYKEFIQ
jgi:hypothetical protein